MSDLTTLADVRLHQQRTDTGNTTQDAIISALISTASYMVQDFLQRRFDVAGTAGTPVSRLFRYDGRGVLNLAPFDLQSVSSVVVDSDTDSPTTLTSDEYRLWPIPSEWGVYSHLHLVGISNERGVADYPMYREVEVSGVWGWSAVPDVVERATIMLTLELLSRTSSWKNDAFDALSTSGGGVSIPLHLRMMLAPYRRHSSGV